jgi:prolipoprotein diacylglyceryltransferase
MWRMAVLAGMPWPGNKRRRDSERVPRRQPAARVRWLIQSGLFFLLWRLRPRVTHDNALLYLYLAAYAFFRFWLEFMADYPPIAFGLTGVQVLCLAILVGQGIGLWRQHMRRGTAQRTRRTAA